MSSPRNEVKWGVSERNEGCQDNQLVAVTNFHFLKRVRRIWAYFPILFFFAFISDAILYLIDL